MSATKVLGSRRRQDIRTSWAEHLTAQRSSGQSQAAYCRVRGLDPKYFSLWKGKLQDQADTAVPRMVPVVVRHDDGCAPAFGGADVADSAAVVLRLNLGNGLSVSLEIALGALPAVVRELSALRC